MGFRRSRFALVRTAGLALLLAVSARGPAQQDDTTRLWRDNLLFAPVRIDGYGEHLLVLDTGASSTAILNERFARTLQLHRQGSVTLGGAGSNECKARLTGPVPLAVSGRKLQPAELQLVDLSHIEKFVGMPIQGVLGGKVFRDYAVMLDFPSSRAFAVAPGERDYATFTAIPLSTSSRLCCIVQLRVVIANRDLQGRFLIDTGAPSVDLVLASRFVQKHKLAPAGAAEPVTLPGLCAATSLLPYGGFAEVRIGSFTVREVSVLLSLDRAGALAEGGFDGIVGGAFLRRFDKVVIDGPNARLLVKSPNQGPKSY